jgi:hypothetical protein
LSKDAVRSILSKDAVILLRAQLATRKEKKKERACEKCQPAVFERERGKYRKSEEGIELGKGQEGGESDDNESSEGVE